jgi:hypothetical protein
MERVVMFDDGEVGGMNEPVDLRVGHRGFEIAEQRQRRGDIAEGGGFDDEDAGHADPVNDE